jgi:hypothetical protein
VVGGSPSAIFGDISANGRVFLINTQGVLFAPGSHVDVGALVASTVDIKNSDFTDGRYRFAGSGAPGASVVNGGTIRTADGGFVVLAGDYVNNTGIIQARLGEVVLASGSAMTLTTDPGGLISYKVDSAALSAQAGVANSGELLADGGRVIMTAKVANDLVGTAVNNSGLVRAQGISEHDGQIELTAGGGDIADSGTLDASNTAGDGGTIAVNSTNNIDLQSGARILASGADQGGSVQIVADGTLSTRAGSLVDAHAVNADGTGGRTELSGHGAMTVRGDVDLGRGGALVLDPTDLTISGGSGQSSSATVYQNFIQGQLKNGTSLQLIASHSITMYGMNGGSLDGTSNGYGGSLLLGIGTQNPSGAFVRGTSGNIRSLVPTDTIQVDGTLDIEAGSQTGTITVGNLIGGNVNLDAPQGITARNVTATIGDLTITGALTESNGGNLRAEQILTAGDINTTAGNLQIIAGDVTVGNISVQNATKDASQLSINAVGYGAGSGGNLQVTGIINISGGGGTGSLDHAATMASASIAATANVTIDGDITVTGNAFTYSENLGQVSTIIKSGNADLSISGQQINLAGVQVNAAGSASFATAATQSLVIGGLVDVSASRYTADTTKDGTHTIVDGGGALIALNVNDPAATVQTNGIKATGPNAGVLITGSTLDLRDNNGDGKAITATAVAGGANASGDYVKRTGSGSGDVESNFGFSVVELTANGNPQAPVAAIQTKSIDVTGPVARLKIGAGGDVKVTGDLSVKGTGYLIDGNPTEAALLLGARVQPYGADGALAPPILLTSGTTNWGTALLSINGASSDAPFAGNVAISGGITVQGLGNADLTIGASSLSVTKDVLITASKGTLQGTAGGSSNAGYQVTRTISNSAGNGPAVYGLASASIQISNSTGDVDLGSLTVRGYSAQAGIFGGNNVTIGDVAVNGKYGGAASDFKETVTYAPSYGGSAASGTTEWKGDRNFFAIGDSSGQSAPVGAVSVGNVSVSGYGFAGITIRGGSISVGKVSLTQADGLFMSNDPGRASSSYSVSNPGAALQILTTSQSVAQAQSITVDAAGTLAQGLSVDVSGNYSVSANSYDFSINGAVFLPHPIQQGSPSSPFGPPLPPNQFLGIVDVLASNITLNIAGNLGLSSESLIASQALKINAGGSIDTFATQLVGTTVSLTAGTSLNLNNVFVGGSTDGGRADSITIRAKNGSIGLGSSTSINGADVALTATGGSVFASSEVPPAIYADALSVQADGSIDLSPVTLVVGSGTAHFGSDPTLLNAIHNDAKGKDISLPGSGPNAAFKAGGGVTLGTISVAGGYIYIESGTTDGLPNFSVGQVIGPSNTLLDYVADVGSLRTTAGTITSLSPRATGGGGSANLNLGGAITVPTGVSTLVFGGTSYTGNITVAGGTTYSPSNANLVFASAGKISGADNLPTTGIVVVINEVGSDAVGELPLQPQDYLPPDTGGPGGSNPGDPYSDGVNDANKGQIDVQTAPPGTLSCSGSP